VLSLGFALACSGSSTSSGSNPLANSGGSPAVAGGGQNSVSGASSAAGTPDAVAGTAGAPNPANTSGGVPASLAAGSAGAPPDTGGSANESQCRTEVPAADWDANCLACAGSDPCAECACTKCAEQLRDCDATPGCPDIAACVRTSGCTGAQCYCGTMDFVTCASGTANGPCKDVMLAAPGGKAPTTADPSAGPASDALLAVNACMQDPNTCAPSCN
jgi:hypothetical protein